MNINETFELIRKSRFQAEIEPAEQPENPEYCGKFQNKYDKPRKTKSSQNLCVTKEKVDSLYYIPKFKSERNTTSASQYMNTCASLNAVKETKDSESDDKFKITDTVEKITLKNFNKQLTKKQLEVKRTTLAENKLKKICKCPQLDPASIKKVPVPQKVTPKMIKKIYGKDFVRINKGNVNNEIFFKNSNMPRFATTYGSFHKVNSEPFKFVHQNKFLDEVDFPKYIEPTNKSKRYHTEEFYFDKTKFVPSSPNSKVNYPQKRTSRKIQKFSNFETIFLNDTYKSSRINDVVRDQYKSVRKSTEERKRVYTENTKKYAEIPLDYTGDPTPLSEKKYILKKGFGTFTSRNLTRLSTTAGMRTSTNFYTKTDFGDFKKKDEVKIRFGKCFDSFNDTISYNFIKNGNGNQGKQFLNKLRHIKEKQQTLSSKLQKNSLVNILNEQPTSNFYMVPDLFAPIPNSKGILMSKVWNKINMEKAFENKKCIEIAIDEGNPHFYD